jgi:hypothetical protein
MTTTIVNHRGWLIIARGHGFDAIQPDTGRWFHRPTMRAAKWAVSAYTNLSLELESRHVFASPLPTAVPASR